MSSSKIKKAKENAKKFKLKKYKQLSTIEGIKQSISQNQPVVYCIDYVPPSFIELYDCKTEDCFSDPKEKIKSESRGMGPMLIVGYDDNKKAVQVLNSWGKKFW